MRMARPTRISTELLTRVLEYTREHGACISGVARHIGVSRQTVHTWLRQAQDGAGPARAVASALHQGASDYHQARLGELVTVEGTP